DAVTHPCPRSEIDDRVEVLIGKKSVHRRPVFDVDSLENKRAASAGSIGDRFPRFEDAEAFPAVLLQPHVVVVVAVVDSHHVMSVGEEQLTGPRADEAGRAGDEDALHGTPVTEVCTKFNAHSTRTPPSPMMTGAEQFGPNSGLSRPPICPFPCELLLPGRSLGSAVSRPSSLTDRNPCPRDSSHPPGSSAHHLPGPRCGAGNPALLWAGSSSGSQGGQLAAHAGRPCVPPLDPRAPARVLRGHTRRLGGGRVSRRHGHDQCATLLAG